MREWIGAHRCQWTRCGDQAAERVERTTPLAGRMTARYLCGRHLEELSNRGGAAEVPASLGRWERFAGQDDGPEAT